jgi:type II secretory ATPase GspE/PulE/Tfp pilus assembly ATPase PilB-like protein
MEFRPDKKYIVDLNILNTYNAKGCEACHQKFNLGDTAVLACGPWTDGCSRLIHERDAVLDPKTGIYFERKYFSGLESS